MKARGVVLVRVMVLLTACAQDRQNSPAERDANGSGHRSMWTSCGDTDGGERTAPRDILSGFVTDEDEGLCIDPKRPGRWILIEEDSDADCGGDKGPLKPGCGKTYFDITGKTRVLREAEGDRTAVAAAADLKKGQRVSVDYTDYAEALSYPSQTDASTVTVLKPFS